MKKSIVSETMMILNGWDWSDIILAMSETTKSYAKCMENQFTFSQWLAKTKIPFEFSHSFLLFNLTWEIRDPKWPGESSGPPLYSNKLVWAKPADICSFIEIRINQIYRPTEVWAPLPSVRSNQPASFIFQERASQFTCFYQLSVSKW